MFFTPSELPRTGFACILSCQLVRAIVGVQASWQILGMTNVKPTLGVLKNVNPTNNLVVVFCNDYLQSNPNVDQKMAPEAGLEPATRRLIPTRRDSYQ